MSRFITLLLAMLLIFTYSFDSYAWRLFELEETSIGYNKFVNDGRDPVLYPEIHKEMIDTHINARFMKYVIWQNNVWGMTTDSQFRAIGYEFRVGVRLSPFVDISYHHHSQHLLDRPSATMNGFPVYDSVEVRIYLYRENDPKYTLLDW